MERFQLKEVSDLQSIKRVPFRAGVSFRQLIVTGPPGVGKTTLMEAIGGWPEEGFLDLTARNWWRSRALAMRPRQLHLGLPFEGHRRGLSVFDSAWLETDDMPALELDRIQLPPLSGRRDPWKLRRKYVFDFLLPPAEEVYEARVRRSDRQSHQVDDGLSLSRVQAQLATTWRVAEHLHNAGIPVYVRDCFGGPPKTFADPTSTEVVEAKLRGEARESRQSFLRSAMRRIISPSGYRVMDRYERVDLRGRRALVPWRVLPIDLTLGDQHLQIHPDGREVRVLEPERYFAEPAAFERLGPGEVLRLSGDASRLLSPGEEQDRPPRIEIAHEGDWLTVADLDSVTGTRLLALHGDEAHRLEHDRAERVDRLRTILGDIPPRLAPEAATRLLSDAIAVLETGLWRPHASDGRPGGLVEIPSEVLPVIVGDLHGRVDNLLTVLSEGRTLDALEAGRAALVLLGDVVHPADGDLTDMTSSLLLTDVVARLMVAFPGGVIHLRGNHETFSEEIAKGGVPQGRLWKERVRRERGNDYQRLLKTFYELLPYVAIGRGFIACHAAPPTSNVSRKRLINLYDQPRLRHQITWGRVRTARRPGGYAKRDVRALQKALDQHKPSVLIVSHDPGTDEEPVALDHGGIKRHHLVYSARSDLVAAFVRSGSALVPVVYPTRHDLAEGLESSSAGPGRFPLRR